MHSQATLNCKIFRRGICLLCK